MPLRARKRFGQHWLRSDRILAAIVAAAALEASDRVLEIGPGTGVLTRRLLAAAASVVAVELDWDLHRRLVRELRHPHLELLQADFLNLDLAAALGPEVPLPNKVVANIPYNITGPILAKLLGTISRPARTYETIVLLVQKEVAERVCARPGTRAFGALTVRTQLLAECDIVCPVPPKAFSPPPKVESAVIRLRPRPYPVPVPAPKQLEILLRLGFASKRKMLRNNLKSLAGSSDRLVELLIALGLDPQARAEDLGIEDWIALCDRLREAAS